MEDKKGIFYKFFKNERIRNLVIISGVIGIILIFISNIFFNKDNNEVDIYAEEYCTTDVIDYEKSIEKKLEDIISSIEGAGKTKVMATLDRTEQTIYATEEKYSNEDIKDNKQSQSNEITYVIVKKSDGTEIPLTVTEIQPKIKGVVVVCEGGGNPIVQERIISAVTTVLDISSTKVCVTQISQ